MAVQAQGAIPVAGQNAAYRLAWGTLSPDSQTPKSLGRILGTGFLSFHIVCDHAGESAAKAVWIL
jgi:hypothetical protein